MPSYAAGRRCVLDPFASMHALYQPLSLSAHRRAHSFLTICKNLKTGKITHIVSQFMMISPGILTTQVGVAKGAADRIACWPACMHRCTHDRNPSRFHIELALERLLPPHALQCSAEERGVKDVDKFKNTMCYAGKHRGVDSAVGNTDLTGKASSLGRSDAAMQAAAFLGPCLVALYCCCAG